MKMWFKSLMLPLFCCNASFGQSMAKGDVIINEILFNPVKDGADFVEGYNSSPGAVLLNELMIANRNASGDIASIKRITKDSILLSPGQFFIVTTDEKWLKLHYKVAPASIVCETSSLPSFPDDEGCVVLVRKTDSVPVDEVQYSAKWHSQFLTSTQGTSLERISYEFSSQDKNNWASAATSAGNGTPGSVNSQHVGIMERMGAVSITPRIFSPGNDGLDDFVSIFINVGQPGRIANGMIFDISGRQVRYLLKNELLGVANKFTWDGRDDRSQALPSGVYIFLVNVFDHLGNVSKYRHTVILNSFPP